MERGGLGIGKYLVLVGLSLTLLASLSSAESNWSSPPAATVQGDDVAYETELQKGSDLLRRRQYEEALKSFKRANEMRGKKSAE